MYILYIQYPWCMVDYVYPVYPLSLEYGDYVYPVNPVSLVYGDYVYPVYPVSLVYGGLIISCISSILGVWLTMYILYIQYHWYMMDYIYPVYPVSFVYG